MLMITAIQFKTAMRIFYISLNAAGKATLVVCIRKLMTYPVRHCHKQDVIAGPLIAILNI